MSDALYRKLIETFRAEAREHLELIRRHVGALEGMENPKGQALDEAFRRAHSLKGAARAVDLAPIETLSHRLETLFARVREGALGVRPEIAKTIYGVLDAIEDWLTAHEQSAPLPSPDEALAAIDRMLGGPVSPPVRASPPPPAAQEAPLPKSAVLAEDSVRISAGHLERLRKFSGEFLTEGSHQQGVGREIRQLGTTLVMLEKNWEEIRRGAGPAFSKSDRISQSFESLELCLRQLRKQVRGAQKTQHRASWDFRRLGDQLREEVNDILKVPAESLFNGFRKMVRDLARDEGKEIEFRTSGWDTEADRRVLQALKDPLMHVLRNAIHHGVEKPEARSKAGKSNPAVVQLTLKAFGNRIQLSVEDDGRGIPFGEIAQAAARKGLLSSEQAAEARPEDLTELLFQAGFSTAPMVTDLSGRGMGLSVVREAVLRLQGEVALRPRPGGGVLCELSVPLSSTSHRLIWVRVKDQSFAIPAQAIDRLLQVQVTDIAQLKGSPVLRISDEPVPLYSLAQLLKLSDTSLHVESRQIPVVVLKGATKRLALAVDRIESEFEGVIVDLDAPLSQIRVLSGGVVMGDGSVVCVLNAAELAQSATEEGLGVPLTVEKKIPAKKTTQILVVDDSITTRTLEKSILEAHGYQVRLAVDGLDALQKLKEELADLAIVDVQMPRMDGFSLVEAMKRETAFCKIPVIMVTSLEEKKDKERGLACGVDAYIVKGKFDHQNLLETIRQIL